MTQMVRGEPYNLTVVCSRNFKRYPCDTKFLIVDEVIVCVLQVYWQNFITDASNEITYVSVIQ